MQAINEEEYNKKKDCIALYYAQKIAFVKQRVNWFEWFFGYSNETEKKIAQLQSKLKNELIFIEREYVYLEVTEEICKKRYSQTIDELKTPKEKLLTKERINNCLAEVYGDIENYKDFKVTHSYPGFALWSYKGALQELNSTIKYLEAFDSSTKSDKKTLKSLYFRRGYLQAEAEGKVKDDVSMAFNHYNKNKKNSCFE